MRRPHAFHPACLLGLAVALGLTACADAPLAQSDGGVLDMGIPCEGGFEVDGEGACSIPGLGQGDPGELPEGEFQPPTLDNGDVEAGRAYFLNQEGDGKFFVYVGQTIRIGVRAVHAHGAPAPGHAVTFEKVEVDAARPSGAVLSAREALTNEFGVAHIDVTGGPMPSFFTIQMSADATTGLEYQVNVLLPPEGDLNPGPGPVGEDPEPGEDPGEAGEDPGEDPEAPGLPGDIARPANCLGVEGTYRITNQYEPARVLGDGIFGVLDNIHRALASPGEFVGDLIRDRIDGIWGALVRGAVAPVIDYLYRYIVDNYAPDWVQWMLIITEDITSILVELEIQAEMDLGRPDPAAACSLDGQHRWVTLVFHWRAGCPAGDDQCGRYEVPLDQLGIAASQSDFTGRLRRSVGPMAELEIDAHELQLNLGVAIIWFVQNVILPSRLDVQSFGELLQLVLPCDAVGALAADYLSGVPIVGFAVGPFVEEACEAGLEAAGNLIVGWMSDALQVSLFSMAGEARLRDQDGDQRADRMDEGRWTQGLTGEFSGERIR